MESESVMSKTELKNVLLEKVNKWISDGNTPEQAIEKLTEKQYDFLIDMGIDFDNLLLTPEQRANARTLSRASRQTFPNGYNKKYPQSKQDLYNSLVAFIESQNAKIIPREKPNYRDLDFTIGETAYRIVLSNPRK